MSEETYLDRLGPFLLDHVEDLEELEILACLAERTSASVPAAAIAEATRFPIAAALEGLERLTARGLVSCTALEPALYRLESTNELVRRQLALVIAEYRKNPVGVMKLMSANAIDRVRTAALRTFADCFRIGGPRSNG